MSRAARAAALLIALAFAPFHGTRADLATPAVTPERSVVTHHVVHLETGDLAYTATAGTLTLRDEHNAPAANVFYVAYTTGNRKRPVTFLYNGGPGSASLWLHIGAFGPRRIVTSNTDAIPVNGARLVDNPATLLDTSDLVFIDPVGTGYSAVTGKGQNKDFWGVDEDIKAFSQFIHRWIAANDRADSPKFLLGESYGTFRSAGLADRLQKEGMPLDGVILLSSLLSYADDFGNPGDENVPDAFAIPSEAAVAWYHKKIPDAPADLTSFLDAARRFTNQEYLPAILSPAPLEEPAKTRLALRLHGFIGIDTGFLQTANVRISTERFERELLHADGLITGRYDGRFTGSATARSARAPEFDPSYDAVAPAFIAAFAAYARTELNWNASEPYRALPPDVVNGWNFHRRGFLGRVLAPTVIPDLREAMEANPNLRVFAGSGLFDLATPFYATEYELANVGREPALRARITLATYPSGHMIYLNADALHVLRGDLGRFYGTVPAK